MTSEQAGAFSCVPTGVGDIDELLSSGKPERSGILCHPSQGFFGVIIGPAGSGKSILALQLCCAYVDPSDPARASETYIADPPRAAIYVSQESPDLIVAKIVESFACFRRNVDVQVGLAGFSPGSRGVRVMHLPFEGDGQRRVISEICAWIHGLKDGEHERVLLCIDNSNSLSIGTLREVLEGAAGHAPTADNPPDGDPRPEELKRLRAASGAMHTYLVFEQAVKGGDGAPISLTAEAYAADVLFHLGVDDHSGYRQRYLEIVKSKNQYYHRGKHCFSIASVDGGPTPRTDGPPRKESKPPVGIKIYPSVATQLSKLARKSVPPLPPTPPDLSTSRREALKDKHFELGIALESRSPERSKTTFYVDPFTCTVLVSDIGTVATQVAGAFARLSSKALYVSFLHRKDQLSRPLNVTDEEVVKFHYFAPEYIEAGKLMHDLDALIEEIRPEVVVIDNAFELGCKYPLVDQPQHFLAALVELFQVRAVTSLIVDTVEVGLGRNPLEKSPIAGLGDNVLLLRSIEFQSQSHTVFSVQKHLSRETWLRGIWHLERTLEKETPNGGPRFVARRTFDAYKNVLTGRPEPVTFAVSLYEDERRSPFSRYLSGMRHALSRTFGRSISVDRYSAEEYPRVQNLILLSEGGAVADCHIMALDEFWLGRLVAAGRLEEITDYAADLEHALRGVTGAADDPWGTTDPFVTAASDMAIRDRLNWPRPWYAVPMLNNFGILCCDPNEVRDCAGTDAGAELVAWLARAPEPDFTWQHLIQLKHALRKRAATKSGGRQFFTLCMNHAESIGSFLIELALGLGEPFKAAAKPGHIELDLGAKDEKTAWYLALESMLELLDDDDLLQLASGQVRPSSAEPLALFSRQWVSTLGCLRSVPRRDRRQGPAGQGQPAEQDELRQEKLRLARLQAYELPVGKPGGHPTPVSGAWYLGILKGSAALPVGVEILKAFSTPDSEISKWHAYLGAPVRASFYGAVKGSATEAPAEGGHYGPFGIPYSARFAKIAKIQADARTVISGTEGDERAAKVAEQKLAFERGVLQENFPFYRMRVVRYEQTSMILRRLMERVAAQSAGVQSAAKRAGIIQEAIAAARGEYLAMTPREGEPASGQPGPTQAQ